MLPSSSNFAGNPLLTQEAIAHLGHTPPCALTSSTDGRSRQLKLNLSSREVKHALGSPRLFQRIVRAGWLKPLFQSRDSLFPVSRVLEVQRRLESGEFPPLLPCEVRQRRKQQSPAKVAA